MVKRVVVLGIVVVLTAAGCGDRDGDSQTSGGGAGDERVLRLSSGVYTERDFAIRTRYGLGQSGGQDLCRSLKDLSDEEIADQLFPSQPQTPGQETDEDDRERAAQIVRNECNSLFPE